MDKKLTYSEDFNRLSDKETELLSKTLLSVQEFIAKSRNISSVTYATRDAHSKSYGFFKGKFLPSTSKEAEAFFTNASYDVLVRFSHAHLKIIKTDRQLPLYGMSLKIKWKEQKEINYPLVNFPVFITNSVSRFLKLFTGINRFYTAPFLLKPYKLMWIAFQMLPITAEMLNPSFIKAFRHFIKKFPDFILHRDYHSIGAFRWNHVMCKLKIVPIPTDYKPNKSKSIIENIQTIISQQPIYYELYAQFSYDETHQPINDLKKEWENMPDVLLGTIELNEVLENDLDLEKQSFNPFKNPEIFQPVGKIQFLRKAIYDTSIQTRNRLNFNK